MIFCSSRCRIGTRTIRTVWDMFPGLDLPYKADPAKPRTAAGAEELDDIYHDLSVRGCETV